MKFESFSPAQLEGEALFSHTETDYDTIRKQEQQEIIDDPETVGFNITNDQLISPRVLGALAEAKRMEQELGVDEAHRQLSERYGIPAEVIGGLTEEMAQREGKKIAALREMLDNLPDGASFRVHPYQPDSPFAIENCRREDGSFAFNPDALQQMKMIYEKVHAGEKPGELTVVMSSYTLERGVDVPETPEEIDEYAEMCIAFLRDMGLEESGGEGICLELGNETNVNRNVRNSKGELMFDRDGFARETNPAKYAHMYAQVARKIKQKFPKVKVAIAGTALFDEDYLGAVIDGVQAESGEDEHLIDKISFHPYRGTLQEGAPAFDGDQCVDSELSYDEQLEHMQALADRVGAEFDIGEVSFSSDRGKNVDMVELHKNSEHARQKGLKTYTWPQTQILTYGV